MKTSTQYFLTTILMTIMADALLADSLTVPNTFTAGTPAIAADVNANFAAVKAAVDDNNARITTNTSDINSNAAAITSNSVAITNLDTAKQNRVTGSCAAGYAIRTVNADGSVVCELDDNSGGDITGVTAGSGLTGGGTTGYVTIDVSNAGITSTHTSNEPGIEYASAIFGQVSSYMTGICSGSTYNFSNITSVTVAAPSSGYVLVSAAGLMCLYDASTQARLALDDASAGSTFDRISYFYTAVNQPCSIGQYAPYSMQVIYPVNAAGNYTYYLKGCVSASGVDGLTDFQPLIAQFFATKY
ncbi:MAG: hypothetical protein HYZ31_13000 [Gammaproteobacteria bacterium]|jgi:hypothetical protein|nr:hypothetical protein [Gammaproteobacteria bacterium]